MIAIRSIFGYAISVIPPATDVRKVSAYALTVDPAQAAVRKASAYALVVDKVALPVNKSSVEALYALINRNTSAMVFNESTLVLSDVTAESYQGYNSKIKVAATTETRGYSGSGWLRYNRVDIGRSFEASTELGFDIVNATTKHALLPSINTAHSLKLVPNDVLDGPVNAGAEFFTLYASDTSLLYKPGSSIKLGSSYVELNDVITVTQLPGFERVTMELSEAITVDKLPGFDPVTQ